MCVFQAFSLRSEEPLWLVLGSLTKSFFQPDVGILTTFIHLSKSGWKAIWVSEGVKRCFWFVTVTTSWWKSHMYIKEDSLKGEKCLQSVEASLVKTCNLEWADTRLWPLFWLLWFWLYEVPADWFSNFIFGLCRTFICLSCWLQCALPYAKYIS